MDCTTDVRRGKPGLYEAWGFPEVWVEVSDGGFSRGRPDRTAAHHTAAPGLSGPAQHTVPNENPASRSTGTRRAVASTA